jgi:uncharacterized protein YndB with AHSA1/START domain
MFELRREDLTFLGRAPVVHIAEAHLAAPRGKVFAALVDPVGWPRWFPRVRAARYASPPPHGVGTIRQALVGSTHWIEELIAWDDDARWAWTVLRASVPLAAAQVESFDLSDAGGGTRIRWTLALEPRLLARLGAPFTGPTVQRLLQRATRNLQVHLQDPGSAASAG